MNTWTRIGLVLLRIVIGWHFLFEGLEKLEATWNHQGRLVFPAAESWALEYVFGEPKQLDKKGLWSAEGYLLEAQGPLAPFFREQAGDPDTRARELLNVPSETDKLPAVLEAEWKDKFDRFAAHYELGQGKAVQPEYVGALAVGVLAPFPAAVPWTALDRSAQAGPPEAVQRTLAEQDFQIAKQQAAVWLRTGSRDVPSKLPGVDGKVHETTPQRIAIYQKKLLELYDIENHGMRAFEEDVWKDKYRALKQEIATMRTELLRDLNKPFEDALKAGMTRLAMSQRAWTVTLGTQSSGNFKLTFNNGITSQTTGDIAYNAPASTVQSSLRALTNWPSGISPVVSGPDGGPYTITPNSTTGGTATTGTLSGTFSGLTTPGNASITPTASRAEVEPPLTSLDWINFITRWGLTLAGVGLILGLFTRTSCLLGAGFLLLFYLAMPALPWLPANPRAEGHYLYINKNIIELIALLTLATTQSGKWFGLDGFVQFLNPWRWRRAAPQTRPVRQQPVMVRQ
jgi:uncharacterized membrane protein YphA (DoxX/SURF4 family)